LRSSKQVDRAVALAERLERGAELVRHGQPQVADFRFRREDDVTVAFAETAAIASIGSGSVA